MKQLITLLLIVVIAVAVTLLAQGNAAKVVVFFGRYRIDVSLNFALISLIVGFFVLHFSLLAVRASGQLPSKFREYFLNRKQGALLDANTSGLIALITGDEQEAQKALKSASKTGIETDLSYLIRAMSCIQSDRLDEAEQVLNHDKALDGKHMTAVSILRATVATARGNFVAAIDMLDALDANAKRLPQVQKLRVRALIGLKRWNEALLDYRSCSNYMLGAESAQAIADIYIGLLEEAAGNAEQVQQILSAAKPGELDNVQVLNALADGLIASGQLSAARKLLEAALKTRQTLDVLAAYHQVAVHESREALPFVEKLLSEHPTDLRLIELAGDVCEQEQLWGKAISRFESVYAKQPSAHLARKLSRLYEAANQADKARQWRDKLDLHLQKERQLA